MFKDRFKAQPDDFVIVVMGPTGSGKTNFINNLTGNAEQRRARHLKSDTQNVVPYPVSYQGLRLVMADTPGFDDTYRPDIEVLRYPDGTTLKIAGIIYLHRITDNRMTGSAQKNLQIFGRLCGNIPLPRTRLVSTMWDLMKDQTAARQRETQLTSTFWRVLTDGGAIAQKFQNTPDSAWSIVQGFLSMGKDGDELLLQEELVEQQKRLNETEAGKVIFNQLQNLLADQKKVLRELAEEAKLQNDPALAKSLQEECDNVEAKLQKTFEEMRQMRIPISRRILLWLFRRKPRAKAVELDYV